MKILFRPYNENYYNTNLFFKGLGFGYNGLDIRLVSLDFGSVGLHTGSVGLELSLTKLTRSAEELQLKTNIIHY